MKKLIKSNIIQNMSALEQQTTVWITTYACSPAAINRLFPLYIQTCQKPNKNPTNPTNPPTNPTTHQPTQPTNRPLAKWLWSHDEDDLGPPGECPGVPHRPGSAFLCWDRAKEVSDESDEWLVGECERWEHGPTARHTTPHHSRPCTRSSVSTFLRHFTPSLLPRYQETEERGNEGSEVGEWRWREMVLWCYRRSEFFVFLPQKETYQELQRDAFWRFKAFLWNPW